MMATMVKQGLLLWSPCPHFLFKPQKSLKQQPIFLTTAKLKQLISQQSLIKKQPRHITAPCLAIDLKEILSVSFPSMAIVVTNALMLTTPLEALAETCEADKSVFTMPLLLFVALIGATVGGLLARQRRGEMERLNEQLRQINAALRKQAKIESYVPSLSYAPIGGRILENEVIADSRKQELISHLKNGKNFLRNQDPEKAFMEFKNGLQLAQNLKDPIEEKKAARGLGASLQRQGKYREAIKYHAMVLEISEREGEDSGNTEAYGAIADCYTELGDLERAANYYDQYIARLQAD